jgi:hypothetical protein
VKTVGSTFLLSSNLMLTGCNLQVACETLQIDHHPDRPHQTKFFKQTVNLDPRHLEQLH